MFFDFSKKFSGNIFYNVCTVQYYSFIIHKYNISLAYKKKRNSKNLYEEKHRMYKCLINNNK